MSRRSITSLLVTAAACLGAHSWAGPGGAAAGGFTLRPSFEETILDSGQRAALGYGWGPPDGNIGVLRTGSSYTFFAPARANDACRAARRVQGTQRLAGSLTHIGAGNGTGCAGVLHPGQDPNGYSFDRDYAGGGPVMPVTGPTGRAALLHVYHGEWHGDRCGAGECFYASLGLAISFDGGASFLKLGEIVQPTLSRPAALARGRNTDVGGGTLLIADAQGRRVADPTRADPSATFLYVVYSDTDPANTRHPCGSALCIAIARAPLRDVIAAAFDRDTAAFPRLFRKYHQDGFSEPATSTDPEAARDAGLYTPVIADVGLFASVLYDGAIDRYLIAYTTGHERVVIRSGADLLHWSEPIQDALIREDGHRFLYATLVGEGEDPAVGGVAPYLYYVKSAAWPDWSGAVLAGRSLRLERTP